MQWVSKFRDLAIQKILSEKTKYAFFNEVLCGYDNIKLLICYLGIFPSTKQ